VGVGAGLYMYDVVVKKFTFAISSPDEFLFDLAYNISQYSVIMTYDLCAAIASEVTTS